MLHFMNEKRNMHGGCIDNASAKMIAFCGLDCKKCDAYIATKNNDQALREKTARLWSELNHATILPEHINCEGCKVDGVKTFYCESLCAIRQCALAKGVATCAHCENMDGCQTLETVVSNNPDAMKNLQEQRLESARLLLRPWRETDAEVLYKYASDPDVGPRAGWPPHKTVDESREIIRTLFNNDTTWAIELKETGEAIGAMGYGPSCDCALPSRDGEPIVGYWVAKPYWNQGICTEALRLMLDHIRKTTDIPSFISGHFVDNPASGKVMEKCGFVPTGEICYDENMYQGTGRPIRVLRLEIASM